MTTPTALRPEHIRDLELRAEAVHPDEPVASAREVLTLIHQLREASAQAVTLTTVTEGVRALADDWVHSPDIQQAAAGRLVLAALSGRPVRGLI